MRTITLSVEGMSCRRCVREVTARLRDVPGVQTVSADAARAVVHLTGAMTTEAVLGAFEGLTYPVRLLRES